MTTLSQVPPVVAIAAAVDPVAAVPRMGQERLILREAAVRP
jgi:hypothetical protein